MKIFFTVLTLAASSKAVPQGRITYGQRASERQFPFYVGISQYSGADAILHCGGAIISNYWVITAAHCVENMAEVTLHMGSTNFFTPEWTLTVTENFITKHPDFNTDNLYNDIALLNTTYIEYTLKINKVSLPSMRDRSDVAHRTVTTIGWGQGENRQHDPRHLKFTTMRAMTIQACQPFLIFDGFDIRKTLCALATNGSTCYGDSGGPLIMPISKILVGISSFVTTEDCALGSPAAFVRVTSYLDWIKTVSGVYRA